MKKNLPFFQRYSVSKAKDFIFMPFIKIASRRLLFLSFMFCLAYSVVVLRLFDVMVFSKTEEEKIATLDTELGHGLTRGNIYDRSHQMLASSLTTYSVYANPKQIIDPIDAAGKLINLFSDLKYEDILPKLTSGKGFAWIKRNLSPQEQYATLKLGIPGIFFQKEEKRFYTQGPLTAHIVGLVDVDGKGVAGVEQKLDEKLRKGQEPVCLSMDLRIQHVLMQELQKTVSEFSAKGGGGIIMDIHNGEILAIGSVPTFDPNQTGSLDPSAMFNRITTGVYEYGSVMKILTSAMVLEAEKANIYSIFDASHPIKAGPFLIKDYKGQNRPMPVWEVFLHSSNIGFVKMAQLVGVEGHKAFLKKMGLFSGTKLEVPGVGFPILPKIWREINTMTIAYGYGISVSPIQAVRAMGAVMNGGFLIEPTLIKRQEGEEIQKERVISEKTSYLVRNLMRLVVTSGTGRKAAAPGYEMIGKTGTANQIRGGRYDKNHVTTTFVGGFPFAKPRYLIMVTLDDPQATAATYGYTTGGWNVAALAGSLVRRIAPLVGIKPVFNEEERAKDHMDLVQTKGIIYENH